MGVYEAVKDALSIARKADNIPLMQALLDAQEQALALQEECTKLKEQVKELQDTKELEKRIIRHECTVVTLNGDEQAIRYCSACWDRDRKLVQVRNRGEAHFVCPAPDNICRNQGDGRFVV